MKLRENLTEQKRIFVEFLKSEPVDLDVMHLVMMDFCAYRAVKLNTVETTVNEFRKMIEANTQDQKFDFNFGEPENPSNIEEQLEKLELFLKSAENLMKTFRDKK